MIFDPSKSRIFFYNEFVDLRKGHTSLAMLVKKVRFKLMAGHLFLFVSRNRKTIKGLFFDGTGLVLLHKKIQAGKFMSFNASEAVFEVNEDEFTIIFHGGHIPLTRSGKRFEM